MGLSPVAITNIYSEINDKQRKIKQKENKQTEKEMQDRLRELNKVFKDIREKKRSHQKYLKHQV